MEAKESHERVCPVGTLGGPGTKPSCPCHTRVGSYPGTPRVNTRLPPEYGTRVPLEYDTRVPSLVGSVILG